MRIIFIGPPGAGKGTQSGRLMRHLDGIHLSTGELLREEIRQGTPEGLEAKQYVDEAQLVPDDLVLGILQQHVLELAPVKVCLFDGFPRNLAQAERLAQMLEEIERPLSLVLELKVADEELARRLVGRQMEENRSDDTPEKIKKRMEIYRSQTLPLIDFYRDLGLLHEVDAIGTEDEVFARILECVGKVRPDLA